MSNVLIENLQTIKDARDNIKTAIENKGTVGVTDDISTYASLIDDISGGSGDVKLFETQEEMQADPDAHEGDKAVVYRSEITNCTASSQFSQATFPATVVLSEAVTDYIDVRFRAVDESSGWFDCWGNLDSNGFMMDCFGDSGMYRVQYESSDGVTYTRTILQDPDGDVSGDSLDFGQDIYYEYEEYWDDRIGEFIKCGRYIFEGLFEYKKNAKQINKFRILEFTPDKYDFTLDIEGEFYNHPEFYLGNIIYTDEELGERINKYATNSSSMYFLSTDKTILYSIESDQSIYHYNNKFYLDPRTLYGGSETDLNSINLITGEEQINRIDTINITLPTYSSERAYVDLLEFDFAYLIGWGAPFLGHASTYFKWWIDNYMKDTYFNAGEEYFYKYEDVYMSAPSQLTLSSSDQLLPGEIAYGKDGVIEGDGSIYQTLDTLQYYNAITGNIYKKSNIVLTTNEINVPAYIKPVNSISGTVLLQYKTKIIPENSEGTFYFPLMFEFSKGYVFYYGLIINGNTSYYIDILDLNYNVIKHTAIEYGNDVFFINSKLFEIENNIYIPYRSNTGSGIRIIKIDSENNISRVVLNNSRVADTHFMLDKDLQNIVFLDTNGIFMYDLEGNKVYEDTTTYKGYDSDSGIMTSDSNYIYIITRDKYLYLIDKSTKTKSSFTKLTDILPNYKRSLNNSNQLYLVTLENNKSMVYKMNGTTPTKVYEYNSNFSLLNNSEFFEDEGYIFSRGYYEVYQLNSYKIIKSDSENKLLNEEDNVNGTKSILLDLNNRVFGTKLLKKGDKFIGHQVTDTGDIYKIIIDTKSEISHDTTGKPMIPYNKSYDKYDKNIGNISWFILSQFDEEDNSSPYLTGTQLFNAYKNNETLSIKSVTMNDISQVPESVTTLRTITGDYGFQFNINSSDNYETEFGTDNYKLGIQMNSVGNISGQPPAETLFLSKYMYGNDINVQHTYSGYGGNGGWNYQGEGWYSRENLYDSMSDWSNLVTDDTEVQNYLTDHFTNKECTFYIWINDSNRSNTHEGYTDNDILLLEAEAICSYFNIELN